MIPVDDKATYYFNAMLADVEWQNGLTPSQREIALNFAQEIILDAMSQQRDVARAYTFVRESLRRFAELYRNTGETFVYRNGESVMVVAK